MSSTQFVEMYHPLIPSTATRPALVAAQAVDERYAKGWLLVDPDALPPAPATPYYTTAAADSRFVQDAQLATKMAGHVGDGSAFDLAQRAAFGSRDPFGALVRWAPPAQTNPTIVNVPTNFYSGTFGATEDVLLILPPTTRTSSMEVIGGRHVRIIGGKIAKTGAGASIRVVGVTGSVFIEGVEIDASGYNGDAINACGVQAAGSYTYPDVYIQNCLIYGLNGTNATVHADLYQAQGPVGRVFVDKFTGSSDYQGIFIAREFPIAEAHLSRINLAKVPNVDQPITYLLWLLGTTELPYPVTLDEVYLSLPAGQTLADEGVAPFTGQTSSNAVIAGESIAALDDGKGNASWPTVMKTVGKVWAGAPAAGDFVAAGSVGRGYRPKGYIGTAPPAIDAIPNLENFTSGAFPADMTRSATSAVTLDAAAGNPTPSLSIVGASAWWAGNAGTRWTVDGDFTLTYDVNINPAGAGTREISNFLFWSNGWPSPNGFGLSLQAASGGLNDAAWLVVTNNARTKVNATAGSGTLYNAGKINDLTQATWYRVTITMRGTVATAKIVRLSDSVTVLDGFTLDFAGRLDASHTKSGVFGKALDGVGSTQGQRMDNITWTMP